MLRFILTLAGFFVAFIILSALSLLYEWLRRKTNIPKIGLKYYSSSTIKRGDYVCINGRVREFDHWTVDNEIIDLLAPPLEDNKTCKGNPAFSKDGFGYNILPSSALRNCEFIYGKYGLKWAISEDYADVAEEKVQQYIDR